MNPKLEKEFAEFMSTKGSTPPQALSEAILARVQTDLNPSALRVFSKLIAIHATTAVVTLSVCPQFGFRVFGQGMGLMHYFMAFGTYGCMIACGAFFTGMSLLIAALVLRAEEIRKIHQNRILSLGAVTLLSLGFFIMVDADILLSLALTWFVGAMLGSWITLEVGWTLRFGRALMNTKSTV